MDDPEGYAGPVTVHIGGAALTVHGRLRGRFDPIDGRFHWYGRLERSPELEAATPRLPVEVGVATPAGDAAGMLGDPDMWGRLRVAGTGRPPFAVPALVEKVGP